MLAWGGFYGSGGGGRYDPIHNIWSPITSTNAPGVRRYFSAVWTGGGMIVWGGSNKRGPNTYTFGPAVDSDSDGYLTCGGDCDDTRSSVYPGAPQVCDDGLNNSCTHPSWPALAGGRDLWSIPGSRQRVARRAGGQAPARSAATGLGCMIGG
jgi:hypothetical protein